MSDSFTGFSPAAFQSDDKHPFLLITSHAITAIAIAPDHDQIAFRVAQQWFRFTIEADCCSLSYITEFDGVDAVIGATITGVQQIEGDEREDDGDYIKPYAVRIVTTKGRATLTFHNRSNGYYDGRIRDGQPVANSEIAEWQQIAADWSA